MSPESCNNYTLFLLYSDKHRYSFNAIISSIETDSFFNALEVLFIKQKEYTIKEIEKYFTIGKKIILCISFFSCEVVEIKEFINTIRNLFKHNIILIAGGPHATGEPLEALKLGFDYVVFGEGEIAFKELLKCIVKNDSFENIEGVYFRNEKGKIVYNRTRQFVDLDKYSSISRKYKHFGPIEITRGCPFGCFYCQTSYIFGKKLRHRSIEKICDDVLFMKGIGLKDFRAITPSAFFYGSNDGKEINLCKIEELLCNLRKILGKEGRIFFGTFPSEIRPEQVNMETMRILKKYVDNDNVVIGAQSGSDRILELCRRGHTVSDIYNAVDIALANGFKVNVDIIFGFPFEKESDEKETIKLINKLKDRGVRIHGHVFKPLPQTVFKNFTQKKISQKVVSIISSILPKGLFYGNSWQN